MKIKIALSLVIALLSVLMISTAPVYAFDPPAQDSSANATDVILWSGDNITISITSGNVTVPNLQESMEAAIDKLITGLRSLMNTAVSLGIIVLSIILAFWHRDPWAYLTAGILTLIYGIGYWGTSHLTAVLIVGFSLYLFVKMWDKKEGKKK